MKAAAVVVLLAVALPSWWRETNSHAAAARGSSAYAKKQYAAAEQSFRRAEQLVPSAKNAFNLGTAEVAAGKREEGSAQLAEAMKDPALRADALFNRGNSALAAKAFDHAVRDYIDALKANPAHAAAKRNLEIALARRESQKQAGANGQKDQNGKDQQQQPQKQPQQGKQKPKQGDVDLDALLRSVQQQEQDELRRMKGKAGEGRVGW